MAGPDILSSAVVTAGLGLGAEIGLQRFAHRFIPDNRMVDAIFTIMNVLVPIAVGLAALKEGDINMAVLPFAYSIGALTRHTELFRQWPI